MGAAVFLLGGCTAEGAPAPTEAEPSSVPHTPVPLPGTDWIRADVAQLDDGGDLRLAVESFPQNFNSYVAEGDNDATRQIVAPTAGGPLVLDEQGAAVLDRDYASSVEVVSRDPQVVEVRLNPDAVWEDGTPITVADYRATWHALNGTGVPVTSVDTTGYSEITSIEAGADEFEVVITFARDFADWESLLMGVVKESIASDPAVFERGFVSAAMPSSGPFVFSEIDAVGGRILLERNPLWWGDAPPLQRILFHVMDRDEQEASFAAGDLDAISGSGRAAPDGDDARTRAARSRGWVGLEMRVDEGPLSDVSVRQAIASVIDRDRLVASFGFAARTQGDHIFLPEQRGYHDGALPHDLDAAAQFLRTAGYARDGGGWIADGEALTVTVSARSASSDESLVAERIEADLETFGIPVDVVAAADRSDEGDGAESRGADIGVASVAGSAFPISSATHRLSAGGVVSALGFEARAALDALWDRVHVERDPALRASLAGDINTVIWEGVASLPLVALPHVGVLRDALANWGPAQFETIDWTRVGWVRP